MNSSTKRIGIAGLSVVLAATTFAGLHLMQKTSTAAYGETDKNIAATYFYDNLKIADEKGRMVDFTLAKKFYKALEEINDAGDFKDGKMEYALNDKGIVSHSDLEAYVVNGDFTIPRAFGAARDAFLTDHPELFYIDFYKLTISVMTKNGEYHAFIDTGREADAYYDNGFKTETAVDKAIVEYNARIDEIADKALKAQASDTYSAKDSYLAKYVNKYLAENIEYDYVAYNNKDDPNAVASANINTAYGGLVVKKAVCGGFARAYKAVMDRLGIPCITVSGCSNNKDESGNNAGSSVFHMWNYVWLEDTANKNARAVAEGEWYSVDVTWNGAAKNVYKYMSLSKYSDEMHHVTDGVISSSGYELPYPELSPHSYGSTGDVNGLQYSIEYRSTGNKDDYNNELVENFETVSYNGKSAKRLLEEDGLYLAYRLAYYSNGELKWTKWMGLDAYRQYVEIAAQDTSLVTDNGNETTQYGNPHNIYSQYCVFEIAPDIPQHLNGNGTEMDIYLQYSEEAKPDEHIAEMGKVNTNQSYGTYTPPPYVLSSTPNHAEEHTIGDYMRDNSIKDKVVMAEKYAFEIEITYNEELYILDESKPIGISAITGRSNTMEYAKFLPLDDKGTLVEIVERPKNSGDPTLMKNTLKFKFMPSLMYEHDGIGYTFAFSNVGSAKIVTRIVDGQQVDATSDKIPNTAYFNFSRNYYACPAYFNYDGRLYVDCCAQPTLVTNSDLSEMDFKKVDEYGNEISTFSENERSQMMLVVNNVSEETENEILDGIDEKEDISVNKDDIIKSQTYDIKLSMCNKYPKISDGSFVRIALGFPEGYGPKDEGVSFKIFHRKHLGGDEYIIEEIPCVVTQFGIVATVNHFSPYMVAVVPADKVKEKTVFASVEGKGGKLTAEDAAIRNIEEGGSYTCTIKPDDGYQVFSVKFNGTEVKERISGDKLTLTYDELDINNEIEIQYIASAAADRYAAKDEFELVSPVKIIVPVGELYPTPSAPSADKNVGAIVGIVIAVITLAAAAVTVTVIISKRKKET